MSQPLIMSFRPDAAEMCLDGRKTMTRRIFKDGMIFQGCGGLSDSGWRELIVPSKSELVAWRSLWEMHESIAIKPKRAACAIGRVMCTGLRVEHVQDITEEDARREGVGGMPFCPHGDLSIFIDKNGQRSDRKLFEHVWRRLNPRGPTSWDSNPLVVVIEFRPLAEGEV